MLVILFDNKTQIKQSVRSDSVRQKTRKSKNDIKRRCLIAMLGVGVTFWYGKCWWPLAFEDVKADGAIAVYVWVVNTSHKCHLNKQTH